METIRIFIASSSELEQDRKEFREFLSIENDRLHSKEVYLELVQWEHFLDTVSQTRLQDEYNNEIKKQHEEELTNTRKRLRTVRSLLIVAIIAIVFAGLFLSSAKKAKNKADTLKTLAEKNLRDFQELKKTSIGAKFQEGIVFYWNDETGKHGLIAAEKNVEGRYTWRQAVDTCANLKLNNYDDWRLPKYDELAALYVNKKLIGGFVEGHIGVPQKLQTLLQDSATLKEETKVTLIRCANSMCELSGISDYVDV
jgi:hypothetical protein